MKSAKKKTKSKPAKATSKPAKVKAKAARPEAVRPFRFTAADTVKIHFAGEKKPESFHVDDMVEATIATMEGQTRFHFQYRLISNDKKNADGSDRCMWFFDPKPVGTADPMDPSLWRLAKEQTIDGCEVEPSCSGDFSTKSVTSYDGSGSRRVVKLGKSAHRMQLDLNGKRVFCDSLKLTIRKGDVLAASEA